VTPEQLASHFCIDHYGNFLLTNAVRPAPDLQVLPHEGYRVEIYRDHEARWQVPALVAAVSRERLFETFLSLVGLLSPIVDVVLESSHQQRDCPPRDFCREHIDRSVLQSHVCDFEDLLVHDGCTGIAVIDTDKPVELQFDEHKLLIVYAHQLDDFQEVLEKEGVRRNDKLKLITEGNHLHATEARYREPFRQFCLRLGIGDRAETINW
jgi:hypothetical protein